MENRPVPLKPPVWTWEVPAYFFVGGAAGAAAVIAAVATAAGADATLARDARWVAAAGALLSPVLLIADLGRPSRFLNMLRVFKLQSAMSVGVWTLVAFSTTVMASVGLHVLVQPGSSAVVTALGGAADAVSALFGLVLATYTGVLIGATAIPVWSAHVRLLPIHFAASSLGAAVSIVELLGHRTPALNVAGIGAAFAETIIGASIELRRNAASRALVEGASGNLTRAGGVLSGPLPLLLRLIGAQSFGLRAVAAIGAIAGSLTLRFGWIAAGRRSALDGRAAVTLGLLGVALVAHPAAFAESREVQPSLKAVVSLASAYVRDYQRAFAFLIADEAYTQQTFDRAHDPTGMRAMHGEMFLTFMAVDRAWIAVHDVADVDGVPVPDRDDLRALIQRGELTPIARRVADRNARFNIGRVTRNFNEPTLGLQILDSSRVTNVKFTVDRIVDDAGTSLVTLKFVERDRPTLVAGVQGKPVFARGEVVIEAATGRVHRTRLELRDGPVFAELTSDYAADQKLGLWVPSIFTERYQLNSGRQVEETLCRATYTNYRKFEVTARIK